MSLENNPGVVLYQGEDKNINFRLSDEESGDAFDITNATEIEVIFPKSDGNCLEKKLTLGQVTIINGGGGKFSVRINAADSVLMLVAPEIGVEVRVTIGGFLTIVQIKNALTVLPSLFPNC